jgi:hypothetical protein
VQLKERSKGRKKERKREGHEEEVSRNMIGRA